MRWGQKVTGRAVAGRIVAGLVAASALVGLAPAVAGAAGGARLSGTVTSDAGGAPIAGARVRLYQDGVGYLEHFADTAADGTWSIEGVPAGSYRVSTSDPTLAHVAEWWADSPTRGASALVAVATADQQLDVALARAGSVSGTLVAPGVADVYLYAGDPATTSATQVLKAQTGTFSFAGLAAGTYHVLVKDPAGVAKDLWYPGRNSRAEALPITLSAGQAFTSTYRQPVSGPGVGTIEGTVIDSEGPVEGIVVQVYDSRTGLYVRAGRTDANGEYRITSIPVGCYKPVFRDPTGAHVTSWWGNGDVITNVAWPCLYPSSIHTFDQEMVITSDLAGVVTDGDAPLAGIKVAVYHEGQTAKIVTTGADGSWVAPNLEPGEYTVGYSDPAKAFVPEYHGGATRRADAEPIALEPLYGTDVEVALTPR